MQHFGLLFIFLSLFSAPFSAWAGEKVVKTYDGHRVICQTAAQVKELARKKAVRFESLGDGKVDIQLVKCTLDGWVQDSSPRAERVDQPEIVNYAIYQLYHRYTLFIVKNQVVLSKIDLSAVLRSGQEIIQIPDWQSRAELFFSGLTEKKNEKGQVVDEPHEESLGSFHIFE